MASTHSIARQLGLLLACLALAGAGCDDDSEADGGHSHDGENAHDDGHGAAAGSGGEQHSHDHDKVIGPLTGAVCPSEKTTLTYENFGKKFFQDYCLGCHSVNSKDRHDAPSDHNFDALVDIEALAAHIDQYAGSGPTETNTKMPPTDPKPSSEERKQLSEWLACGAPEK
jgi:hypothetical protein